MRLVYTDKNHSYTLDGRKAKGASNVAKICADMFTVEQWDRRQIAIGMALDPGLAEQVAVDLDNRDAIQGVCEQAKETAKAHSRSRRGTQRHRVLELVLLEREDEFITDQQRADAEVLRRTLDRYQLEPLRDRVEQFVAWPEFGVVGRYDAILLHQGRPVLTDLKGGENAVKYPHSTAVQEALYLFAPWTSKTIERNGDRSTVTEWTTMPDDIDTEVAYVIYCDDQHDVGELWRLDMNHGYVGAQYALHIVNWRKQLDYGRALANKVAALDTTPPVSSATAVAAQPAPPPATSRPGGGANPTDKNEPDSQGRGASQAGTYLQQGVDPSEGLGMGSPSEDSSASRSKPDPERRQALLERYWKLSELDKKRFDARHTHGDLDDVERILNEVEATVAHPSARATPTPPPPPSPAPPGEGGDAHPDDIRRLRQQYEALPDEAKHWVGSLVAQGNAVGVGWSTSVLASERRYQLGRAIVNLAGHSFDGEYEFGVAFLVDTTNEIVRGLLEETLGDNIGFTDTYPLGAALGTLDHTEAAAFAALVDDYLSPTTAA